MNLPIRKTALLAAAFVLFAAAVPLVTHAQQALDIHTMTMTFDMPNMTPQQFRVTSQTDFDSLTATATSDPADETVCTVEPALAGGTPALFHGEKEAVFTVTPKAPGTCTIHLSDPKLGEARMVATVNLHGIYVIDGNAVKIFPAGLAGSENPSPIATIAGPNTRLDHPSGLAIDKTGNVYVANAANNSVTVYAANRVGDRAPIATITGTKTELQTPWSLALDEAGNIYVANTAGGPNREGSITVYKDAPRGIVNHTPLVTIAGPYTLLSSPRGVALDSKQRIYAVNHVGTITVYAPLAGREPAGMRDEAPVATIGGSQTQLMQPTGIALDTSGKIYVTNTLMGTEQVGHIEVYAADPIGTLNEAPLATITGPRTALGLPEGIAVDENGEIVVVNPNVASLTPSVTRYTINGDKDVSPLMMLVGSNVESPSGVAIH